MKYFIDFEFIEGFRKPLFGKKHHFIDMISIGIYREDGESYHCLSSEYRYKDASDWVKENVILPIYKDGVHGDARNHWSAETFHKYFGKTNEEIKFEVLEFFGCWHDVHFWRAPEGIEVYGYYSDYDWVLLCSLFGRMIDLPKGFPMYCIDLKQTLDEKLTNLSNSDFFTKFHIKKEMTLKEKLVEIKKHTQYPKQENEHNAAADAAWNYQLYKFLQLIPK